MHAPPTPDATRIADQVARRSFAILATSSPHGRPHAAGVLYVVVAGDFYVNTLRTSRKARDIAGNPAVSLCVPIRRVPVGPPSSVQLQGSAEVLSADDPHVIALIDSGALRSITSHGELDQAGSCFLRITPESRVLTYGLGLSLRALARDPLHAGGRIDWPDVA